MTTRMNKIEELDVANARAIISCDTKSLKETLEFLLKPVPRGKKRLTYVCEITIKTNELDFSVIGAQKVLYCKASGPAKITVPLAYLYDIVKNVKTYNCLILVSDWTMKIEKTTFRVNTFFFQDDSILRSINLPINYTPNDILLLKNLYTPEEITFNDLDNLFQQTYDGLNNDIAIVSQILSKYGFKWDEVFKIVNEKIFVNNSKTGNDG